MNLSTEEFFMLRNLIYKKAGIFFEPRKIYFVKKRVEKRMDSLQLESVSDYIDCLNYQDRDGRELQTLLNSLTTNETYFFRESNQLDAFVKFNLPDRLKEKKRKGDFNLRIWSAGCSSGEEPYTLAMLLLESLENPRIWKIQILATDIDTQILQKAQEGLYDEHSVRNVSPEALKKYFLVSTDGFRVRANIKEMVSFVHMNLYDHQAVSRIRNVDFLFCRNVLIYFDDASRKAVVADFYDALAEGGYIYLGHSEALTRIHSAFAIRRAGGFIVHQKIAQEAIS